MIREDKVKRLLATVARLNDPYVFYAFELAEGGVKILAGCRWFTLAEYRDHIPTYGRPEKELETSRILDFIEARMGDLGVEAAPSEVQSGKRAAKATKAA